MTSHERAVLCIHCGEAINYDYDSKLAVYSQMKRHEVTCLGNPLRQALDAAMDGIRVCKNAARVERPADVPTRIHAICTDVEAQVESIIAHGINRPPA